MIWFYTCILISFFDKDVAVPQGTVDFEAAPIWRQQVKETNNSILASLAELVPQSCLCIDPSFRVDG